MLSALTVRCCLANTQLSSDTGLAVVDDDYRVLLDDCDNDYINASLVKVPESEREYILTQVREWTGLRIFSWLRCICIVFTCEKL